MHKGSLLRWLPAVASDLALVVVTYVVVVRLSRRLLRYSTAGRIFLRRCERPSGLLAALFVADVSLAGAPLSRFSRGLAGHAVGLALIGAVAWLVVEATFAAEDVALARYDIGVADNLRARKLRTQITVLRRVTVVAVSVTSLAVMLTTFSQVRALGASLLASAGIAGVIAGTAARPTMANVVAGIQIAFTEPIRIDDVVVVEGQWGRIEEITLTYVTVHLWDRRRLLVPISYFVSNAFENWTRASAQIIGSAFLYLDYQVPIEELRAAFEAIVAGSSRWDGQVAALQVTDAREHTVEVRAIMSAPDSGNAFDLRCEVRERLIAWLTEHHPASLPRSRVDLVGGDGNAPFEGDRLTRSSTS